MVKRLLVLSAVLLVATTGLAGAQTYPPAEMGLRGSTSVVAPGGTIDLEAFTFPPGCVVSFTLVPGDVLLGTVVTGDDGVARLTATIPSDTAPGVYTIAATCTTDDGEVLSVSMTITVRGPGAVPPGVSAPIAAGPLPATGSDAFPIAQVGVGALFAGGALVLIARQRRSARATT